MTALIYWVIPHWKQRRYFMVFSSALFLFTIVPYAIYIGIYFILSIYVWPKIWKYKSGYIPFWLAVVFSVLPLVLTRHYGPWKSPLVAFGLAFMTVRAIGVLFDSYRTKQSPQVLSQALYFFFFPTYSAGPVEHLSTFSPEKAPKSFDVQLFITGSVRVVVGVFKSMYLGDLIIYKFMKSYWTGLVLDPATDTVVDAWLFMVLRFIYTYVNFSGYSDIAIGSGNMLGFKIQENFNLPFLATNLQDFWKRWHISMGAWVMRYIFFPLASIFRTEIGMISSSIFTFVLLGLWHESSWNYFVWGVGHGVGMAVNHVTKTRFGKKTAYKKLLASSSYGFVCVVITVLYVSFLQTFANMPTWQDGVVLTKLLFGIGL
ncbi:MAG: MBOAT family O-acyltransferase [Bdellovibrionota bacterium]